MRAEDFVQKELSHRYDMLKVFSTILVVAAHSTAMCRAGYIESPSADTIFLHYITKFIYSFHMPLFIAVSGMVYSFCLRNSRYQDLKGFIHKKINRLLIPYYIWGLILVTPVVVCLGYTDMNLKKYMLSGILLVRDSRHLWYIFCLFDIFLICYVYQKIKGWIKHQVDERIILLLLVVINLGSGYVTTAFAARSTCYYLLFFYVGVLLDKYHAVIRLIAVKPAIVLLQLVIICVFFMNENDAFIVVTALCGIGFIYALVNKMSMKICESRFFESLRRDGYGIYIFHPMIIYVMFYYTKQFQVNRILLCICLAVASYFLSIMISHLIRLCKLGFTIGESR